MAFLDRLIGVIAPHQCLGCEAEGGLLCVECLDKLPTTPECCYRCRKISPGGLTCLACRKKSRLVRVNVGTIYEGIAKDIIWKLKLAGAQAAAKCMADRLCEFISQQPKVLIVPVPTATNRSRRRGYDQAKLLARALAQQTHQPYADCLARLTQSHQHGWSRRQRFEQLANAFRVRQLGTVRGAHIVLVDDVVTTGATIEAAAAVLKAAGAHSVEAVAFARP